MISQLFAMGMNLKMAQDLARHSDAKLTLKRYAHTEQATVVEAIDRLPQYLAATGTDGMRLDQRRDENCPHQRTIEDSVGGIGRCDTTPKSLRLMPSDACGGTEMLTEEHYTRRESNLSPETQGKGHSADGALQKAVQLTQSTQEDEFELFKRAWEQGDIE